MHTDGRTRPAIVTTRKLTSCRQEGSEEIASYVCAARWLAAGSPVVSPRPCPLVSTEGDL